MAKFHLCQRVKIVGNGRSPFYPEALNKEAIIDVAYGRHVGKRPDGRLEFVDGYGVHVYGLGHYLVTEDEIEPILPEGLEADELIDELYEPDTIHLLEHMNT